MSTVHRIQVPIPFPLQSVNCWYISDSIPTLIDAGINTEEGFEVVKEAVSAVGGTIEGIRRIILTHCHLDHMGLAGRLSQVYGAEVHIHQWDRNKIVRGSRQEFDERLGIYREFFLEAGIERNLAEDMIRGFLPRLEKFFSPLTDEKPLHGGEVFPFDDFELEVIHTPGHSPGSVCLYNRRDEVLFSGDTLLEEITSNPVVELKAPEENHGYRSLVEFETTLKRLKELSVITVLPGHGAPYTRHAHRVEELQNHHKARTRQVLEILAANQREQPEAHGMTELMVCKQLFPSLNGMDIFLGLSEARAHLEWLEKRGLVSFAIRDGHRVYRAVSESAPDDI